LTTILASWFFDSLFSKIRFKQMKTALGPLRILDFSRILAGPLATMVLADLGAEVTKVERPGGGDDTRSWGPPYDAANGEATYFQALNRNKASIALDLADSGDLSEAKRLAAAADVVVENFRPGLMEQFGLGYEALAAANPGLVYCSITGFGSGSEAPTAGFDLLVQALGGLMSITGERDGPPLKVGVALVDVIAGLFAAVGILAALEHRRQSGEGQRVEVDLMSSLLAALVNQSAAYTVAGEVPARLGNRHPSIAPYESFETGAGQLVIACGNDRQFAGLCEALGLDGIAADARFATNSARVHNVEELAARIEAALSSRSAVEWAQELSRRRVPAGVVNDIGAAFRFAAEIGLDPIVTIPREDGTGIDLPRNPIRLSATPASYRSAPPPPPKRRD
jgi:crotonobetainyl-CoA:carnitine CoA-transferase CaiB-like acyl-CoA transferase